MIPVARLVGTLAVAGVLLGGAGCLEEPAREGSPAIPFELELLGGGRTSLAHLAGKIVLVDFWATWCPPCVLEIPELASFYKEYSDDGVELLAIAVDEPDAEALATWANEHGIAYPVAIGTDALARAYGATGFPFHVLISADGRVLERLTPGYHDRAQLDELLARHR